MLESMRPPAGPCRRVHAKHLGFPLLGDDLYGGTHASGVDLVCGRRSGGSAGARQLVESFTRPALHALTLGFQHPVGGERLQFKSELALDFVALLELLDAGVE
jgi:23S rRNA-/tRNA-specific pseudouridylate synthase